MRKYYYAKFFVEKFWNWIPHYIAFVFEWKSSKYLQNFNLRVEPNNIWGGIKHTDGQTRLNHCRNWFWLIKVWSVLSPSRFNTIPHKLNIFRTTIDGRCNYIRVYLNLFHPPLLSLKKPKTREIGEKETSTLSDP